MTSIRGFVPLPRSQSLGRTIKNLVRTAQALAMSSYVACFRDVFPLYLRGFRDEPLSSEHVKVVVEAQEKFLTEFAHVKL